MSGATPFRKLLVANRGEIALRVMRSARALGLRTVAVHSTADAGARHVREADQAVCIGEPLPAQSYLNIPAILEAARRSGAEAVHPGYGFLAENAAFARACRDAGLVFVGPSAEAIAAMGHKAGAKRLMQAAGVPCIPGYEGGAQDDARLAAEAARIGFPLMVKAAAGGGGRGMRRVERAEDVAQALHSARSEAQAAFGDPALILERAITQARHIEIQVLADRHGQVVHLGERDCSVQRRHQKLIEEAPSPAVDAALRARMGAAAVAAAKAVGYEGAGTLEFLLDEAGQFYFMEMNTRLQVEHAVTEAVTGLDLVALQLRIAAGEPLPFAQAQVPCSGHAIEVRLCAEDAQRDFLPQSGTLALWRPPAALRVDTALADGAAIPPFYDSMIAKLVAHGRDREEARRRLLAGLEDLVALGVVTNQAFLQRCLAHPVFVQGQATTEFIALHHEALRAPDADARARAAALAAALLCSADGEPRALAHALPVPLRLRIDGTPIAMRVQPLAPRVFRVNPEASDAPMQVALLEWDGTAVRFACDGLQEHAVCCRGEGGALLLHYRGTPLHVVDATRAAVLRAQDAQGDGRLAASMTGRVVAVLAAVGDAVQAGQPLVTLEAMKMEHVHAAPVSGRVAALHVREGEQVTAGRVLADLERAPHGASH